MEIILLEKVDNVGSVGDRVTVKAGYARNYLIPKGKATLATPDNIAKFELRRAELLGKAQGELVRAQGRAALLEGKVIAINAKAGVQGKLFGSVGTLDIVEACVLLGAPVERSEVRLPEGPIRMVGEHKVELHLHTDVNVELTVNVEAEAAELEEQAEG
ncbi:MAG: 50S ribosomal protein L9 [Gammaproteobacteria bacterium]